MKIFKAICFVIIGVLAVLPMVLPVFASSDVSAGFKIPLTISDVTSSSVTKNGAIISWQTNSDATSQVFYDIASHQNLADYNYYFTANPTKVNQHTSQVSTLDASTVYHYRVKSVTTVGVTQYVAISNDNNFQTADNPVQGG